MGHDFIESFHIDDGELDGLSDQRIFVLGIEYQTIMQYAREHKTYDHPIHVENVDRLTTNLQNMGFIVSILPIDDDFKSIRWVRYD